MPVKVLEIISQGYVAGGAETILLKRSSYLLNKGYSVKILASDLGEGKQHFNDYTFKSINNNSPLKLLFTLFTFKAVPQRSELPATINEHLVVELYSK